MKLYHYTTIDTLALILKNRTIRFNRLDKVDDLEEKVVSCGVLNIYLLHAGQRTQRKAFHCGKCMQELPMELE